MIYIFRIKHDFFATTTSTKKMKKSISWLPKKNPKQLCLNICKKRKSNLVSLGLNWFETPRTLKHDISESDFHHYNYKFIFFTSKIPKVLLVSDVLELLE